MPPPFRVRDVNRVVVMSWARPFSFTDNGLGCDFCTCARSARHGWKASMDGCCQNHGFYKSQSGKTPMTSMMRSSSIDFLFFLDFFTIVSSPCLHLQRKQRRGQGTWGAGAVASAVVMQRRWKRPLQLRQENAVSICIFCMQVGQRLLSY